MKRHLIPPPTEPPTEPSLADLDQINHQYLVLEGFLLPHVFTTCAHYIFQTQSVLSHCCTIHSDAPAEMPSFVAKRKQSHEPARVKHLATVFSFLDRCTRPEVSSSTCLERKAFCLQNMRSKRDRRKVRGLKNNSPQGGAHKPFFSRSALNVGSSKTSQDRANIGGVL